MDRCRADPIAARRQLGYEGAGFLPGVLQMVLDNFSQISVRALWSLVTTSGAVIVQICLRCGSHLAIIPRIPSRSGQNKAMREDLRPFWVKQTYLAFRATWIHWFVRPRCAHLGSHATIMSPWYVDISGPNITIGHSFTAINTASQRVQIGVWGRRSGTGRYHYWRCVLDEPGVSHQCQ